MVSFTIVVRPVSLKEAIQLFITALLSLPATHCSGIFTDTANALSAIFVWAGGLEMAQLVNKKTTNVRMAKTQSDVKVVNGVFIRMELGITSSARNMCEC